MTATTKTNGPPRRAAVYPVSQSPLRASDDERKRSALVGVQYAKRVHVEAEARFLAARENYAEAIVAARDQGATVAEIAQQAGVSRNAIYLLMARREKARR